MRNPKLAHILVKLVTWILQIFVKKLKPVKDDLHRAEAA